MKKNYLIYLLMSAILVLGISCNDFLDEVPDNRAEIDTEEKVKKLLVSAYPDIAYCLLAEFSSDNTDENLADPNGGRTFEQMFNWEEITEVEVNDVPKYLWESCYAAIACANLALDAIDKMKNPESLKAAKAEALMARAYSHFILVNMFCQHYTKEHSGTDLGIHYMDELESELFPTYERGTVADVYSRMADDIKNALPDISDEYYSVPKYHFNVQAANAFAARFYLYYQNWDSAIICASTALGSVPKTILRDNVALSKVPDEIHMSSRQYVQASHKCNFLLTAHNSAMGLIFGPFTFAGKYSHGTMLSKNETWNTGLWGTASYIVRPFNYTSGMDKVMVPRFPYLFEITNPVAQTGRARSVFTDFTAEETLLVRAEAYIMKKNYTDALKDINLWVGNTLADNKQLTEKEITDWVKSFEYYQPEQPTPKKRLNPEFSIDADAGLQESYVHCILHLRRLETMHTGMRWFDVKRYGIEVWRRGIENGVIASVKENSLAKRDARCALQIPTDIISAGLTPNPR